MGGYACYLAVTVVHHLLLNTTGCIPIRYCELHCKQVTCEGHERKNNELSIRIHSKSSNRRGVRGVGGLEDTVLGRTANIVYLLGGGCVEQEPGGKLSFMLEKNL